MAPKSRKKRLRLSFIGGRRPSLLVKPEKVPRKQNKPVEKAEVLLPTPVQTADDATQKENDVLSLINATYEVALSSDTEKILLDKTNKTVRSHMKDEEGVEGYRNEEKMCSSDQISTDFTVHRKDSFQTMQTRNDECVENALKVRLEELKHTICTDNNIELSKISQELRKWEQVGYNMFPFDEDTPVPKELEEIVSLDFNLELEELQSMHNRLLSQQETLKDLEMKFNILKLRANDYLSRLQNDIQSGLNVDVTQNMETPRQLIKKIVQPK